MTTLTDLTKQRINLSAHKLRPKIVQGKIKGELKEVKGEERKKIVATNPQEDCLTLIREHAPGGAVGYVLGNPKDEYFGGEHIGVHDFHGAQGVPETRGHQKEYVKVRIPVTYILGSRS